MVSTTSHNLEAELAEYNTLRTELLQKIEQNNQLITLTFTAVIAILAFAVNAAVTSDTNVTFLFVVPMGVIIPISRRISYYRSSITKLSAYIVVYLEDHIDGLNWESRNSALAQAGIGKNINHIKSIRNECFILSIICYACYLQSLLNHISGIWYQDAWNILWPFSLVVREAYVTYDVRVTNKERANWIGIWTSFKLADSSSAKRIGVNKGSKYKY